MGFHQEATFHDRQSVESAIPQSTSSNTFVDVIGGTITTKDLSQEGTYQISTPVVISASLNNTIASFRITLDGNQIGQISILKLKIKDFDIGFTFTGTLPGTVTADQVMQVQYLTDKGTILLSEFSMTVDGIPASRVVQ